MDLEELWMIRMEFEMQRQMMMMMVEEVVVVVLVEVRRLLRLLEGCWVSPVWRFVIPFLKTDLLRFV
jgi:hypothetical protein